MATPLKQSQVDLTNKGHEIARRVIYPKLFGRPPGELCYEGVFGDKKDVNLGIDKVVCVPSEIRNGEFIRYPVQERFRRYNERFIKNYPQITITEWNGGTGVKSELYKIAAFYFVYGYLDGNKDTSEDFHHWIVVRVPDLLFAYNVTKKIQPVIVDAPNDREQTYIAFSYQSLYKNGLVVDSYNIDFAGKATSRLPAQSDWHKDALEESCIKYTELLLTMKKHLANAGIDTAIYDDLIRQGNRTEIRRQAKKIAGK